MKGVMTVSGVDARPHAFRWQASPWGRLRCTLTEANLLRHLDRRPRRVLDVAGGYGLEAVRLAARGHEVTVLDPAGAMLRNAKEHAEAFDVADRLHVVQAAAEDAPELFAADDFDLVLCHNLLQYVEDRRAVLEAVTVPLRRGGLLSVLAPNPGPGEPAECTAAGTFADLTLLGFGLVLRYGVGCVRHGRPDDTLDDDPVFLAELERLELSLSDQMPQLLTARFFHLIAHR
jgi:SAM-dependent methyltransferase